MADRAAFRRRVEEAGGRLHEAGSLGAARARARELTAGDSAARWADPELDEIAVAHAPPADAEISLVVADLGVADTGAIALVHGTGRGRATGLLPPRQIALLASDRLVQSVAEALGRLMSGAPPSNVVLVCGPSRTADIEQRLVRGAHAPRELDVILFERGDERGAPAAPYEGS